MDKSKQQNIIYDSRNNPVIVISNVRFKGKRNIDWMDVERYVKEYVGSNYEVAETSDIIYIGANFPDEFKGSDGTDSHPDLHYLYIP